jgi:hypothetical protein
MSIIGTEEQEQEEELFEGMPYVVQPYQLLWWIHHLT